MKALATEPPLFDEARFYLSAFHALGPDRPPAMAGMTFIPNAAIQAYAERIELTKEEADNLFTVIREIDDHYVSLQNKRQASLSK